MSDEFVLLTRKVVIRAPKRWDDDKADSVMDAILPILDLQLELAVAGVRGINPKLSGEVVS